MVERINDSGKCVKNVAIDHCVLRKKIRDIERGFEWKGAVLMIIGVLMNMPYVILIMSIEDSIRYSPS